MNKKIRDNIKKLGLMREDLHMMVRSAEDFLFADAKNFKSEKSLKAIESIKNKVLQKKEEIETLEKEINELTTHCNHEIIIDGQNKYCAVCGKNIYEDLNNPAYVYDFEETLYIGETSYLAFIESIDYCYLGEPKCHDLKLIDSIIEKTIDSNIYPNNAISEMSVHNIKIRRLKNEKK